MNNYTTTYNNSVAEALPEERAVFIRKTYFHLAGAILAFILLEGYIMFSGLGAQLHSTMLGSQWGWLLVLLAFMGVSMLANWWANSQTSKAMQYLGLGVYTIAEAIILPRCFLLHKPERAEA